MMIFYPSTVSDGTPTGPSLKTIRVLTLVALAAYPAGALIRTFAPETESGEWFALIAGYGLILLSLLAAAPVMGSRLQRIVADDGGNLDEMELQLRHRALSWSYNVAAGVFLTMLIYGAIASDIGLWVPSGYDEWNGMFWGGFLYLTLLPTARLAWTMDAGDAEED